MGEEQLVGWVKVGKGREGWRKDEGEREGEREGREGRREGEASE